MLNDFDFDLPQELIAQERSERGNSRLLYRDINGSLHDKLFKDITKLLREGDILVLNDTRVIPSCLYGAIDEMELKINLINKIQSAKGQRWEFLSKPRKRTKVGSVINFSQKLIGVVVEKFNESNMDVVEFSTIDNKNDLNDSDFYKLLDEVGQMPLPPYIRRNPTLQDKDQYQTIFSKVNGSVAAPTAGLHFTDEILHELKIIGVKIAYITLHVGGGTFLPVRSEDISKHKMHSEFYSIDDNICNLVNNAKANNNRVVAVGTTVTRTLESAAIFCGNDLYPHSNYTNIFIREDFRFKVVDALITNFHLPKSTLFMLVCSFLGSIDAGQDLYKYAIDARYKFFSYGDPCFLIR
jgi:S-adenosylmethionine:tRNA ribosyltransferase-isomerase